MKDIPFSLYASLTNFSLFMARRHHPKFRAIAKKVWQRDAFKCYFCGFQALDYQEVINLNQNYRDNHALNLATACVFCTQCFFLESVGEHGYGGGSLIYLPEISQPALNAFCHVLFCAMVNHSQYGDSAQSIYQLLKMRTNVIEKEFGEGMSDPVNFSQVLLDYKTRQNDQKSAELLKQLRLLPARGSFSKQIEYWARAASKPA
jgi:intracellular multiplication protein IcmJ